MYFYVRHAIQRLLTRDDGVTAIEYGLIAALITVVIIVSLSLVGQEVETTFNTWTTAVHNAVQNSQGS
ncbi:MAG: Flp family type IVb pilin [Alphaproteobacteria bacterium]|nr:Flp family type IVb pilin [Alphaproteobacteria bacterium]